MTPVLNRPMTVSAIEGQEAFDPISGGDAVSRPRRGIVVAVADAADRRFDAGMLQALGVLDRQVLNTSVAVMDQAALHRPASLDGLVQGIEHEACPIRSLGAVLLTFQPTMVRAKTSITKAR